MGVLLGINRVNMKKTGLLISVILVLSIFVPVFAFAGKPAKAPRTLEKSVYIHCYKGHSKPDWVADKKPQKDDGHSDHYAVLGKGVVWKDDDLPLTVEVNRARDIVTHELGHGIGLADIYDCELETMYGYSTEGDIIKRDLYDGGIAGL